MNKIQLLQQAIANIWAELPELIGDDWEIFSQTLHTLLQQLEMCNDPDDADALYDEIQSSFLDYELANTRLWSEKKSIASKEGSLSSSELPVLRSGESFPAKSLDVAPEQNTDLPVTRFSDIIAPTLVSVDQRFPIIVCLTCQPEPNSYPAAPLQIQPGQTIEVTLTPLGQLELLGARRKSLTVLADIDSEPLVFFLKSRQSGKQVVRIDFCNGNDPVSTHDIEIITTETADLMFSNQTISALISITHQEHPDVVLRISTLGNKLHFELNYKDLEFREFSEVPLQSDPEKFRTQLVEEIEALSESSGGNTDYVMKELQKIGQRLYRQLWPEDLRMEYRQFHKKNVNTFYIASDEPWIPWELLKPYDAAVGESPNEKVDDDFLCLQYDFSRWFLPSGQKPPLPKFSISSLAAIRPDNSNLITANDEIQIIRNFATERGYVDYTPSSATLPAVEELLSGDAPIQLWHFACHGEFKKDKPGESPLILQEGYLRPNDLVGKVETRLRTDRPLIFLNACQVGASAMSLTGLDGWAKVLIQDCWVGAFLAPIWNVDDEYACQFAQAFYQALFHPNSTLSQAVRQARCKLRERAPNDPIWLAYALYGHPNAVIKLAAEK